MTKTITIRVASENLNDRIVTYIIGDNWFKYGLDRLNLTYRIVDSNADILAYSSILDELLSEDINRSGFNYRDLHDMIVSYTRNICLFLTPFSAEIHPTIEESDSHVTRVDKSMQTLRDVIHALWTITIKFEIEEEVIDDYLVERLNCDKTELVLQSVSLLEGETEICCDECV